MLVVAAVHSLSQPALAQSSGRPSITIDDATVAEGSAGTVNASFTVRLSEVSNQTVSVNYRTADGTADAPGDYSSTNGTITFSPGQIIQTINVLVKGDTIDEVDETFFVNLSSASRATIEDPQGLGTIRDDDPQPTISIGDAAVTEGDSGTVSASFTVSLSSASGRTVTVGFATQDGTATAPADYTTTSGTLTFNSGQTSRTVIVPVKGDEIVELDETFFVNLANATGAVIADSQGVGTIRDNDSAPTSQSITIADTTVVEDERTATFTVTRSGAIDQSASVNFITADGTASAPTDYLTAAGILVFAPFELTKTIDVQAVSDTNDEPNETFFVNLSNPTNAGIRDPQAVGTILDDDFPPGLSINDATVVEGDAGVVSASFTVTLAPPSGQSVSVQFRTVQNTATADVDYAQVSGTLTFSPLQTSRTVVVPVIGDTLPEVDESFFVDLSNPINAGIVDGRGVGTIEDDDGTEFFFSWYDGTHSPADWVVVGNLGNSTARVRILIPSPIQGPAVSLERDLSAGQVLPFQFPGTMGGPVRVQIAGVGIASIRSLWGSGANENFEEVSGAREPFLTHYWPWYDGVSTNGQDWIHVVNPGTSTATVTIRVAGVVRGDPITVPGGQNRFYTNPALQGGPVVVTSTVPVLASQRVLWAGINFSETPSMQQTSDTSFSFYDSISTAGRDWIVIGNPGSTAVTATITIGNGAPFPPITIQPDDSAFPTFPNVQTGPVRVTATGGSVVVSQRALWGLSSMEEVPGAAPASKGSFSWYDAVSTGNRDWVLVTNVGSSSASFSIRIGAVQVYCAGAQSFCGTVPQRGALAPKEIVTPRFAGVRNGPVVVTGSSGSQLVISRRTLWGAGSDFTELLGAQD